MLSMFIFVFFFGLLIAAAYFDFTTMKIPNKISLILLVGFFVASVFLRQGWPVFFEHLLVGFSVFAFSFLLFAIGGLGAGDSKLMAATAFWWQWPDLLMYVVYSTLAGGLLSVLVLLARTKTFRNLPFLSSIPSIAHDPEEGKRRMIPYGIALAIGALLTLPQSEIFKAAANIG